MNQNNRSIKNIFVKKPGQVYSVVGFFNFRFRHEYDTADHLHQKTHTVEFSVVDIIVNRSVSNVAFKIHVENLHPIKEWIVEVNYRLQEIVVSYAIETCFAQKLQYLNNPRIHVDVVNDDGISKYFY